MKSNATILAQEANNTLHAETTKLTQKQNSLIIKQRCETRRNLCDEKCPHSGKIITGTHTKCDNKERERQVFFAS